MDPTEHVVPTDIEKPTPVLFWDQNVIKPHSEASRSGRRRSKYFVQSVVFLALSS